MALSLMDLSNSATLLEVPVFQIHRKGYLGDLIGEKPQPNVWRYQEGNMEVTNMRVCGLKNQQGPQEGYLAPDPVDVGKRLFVDIYGITIIPGFLNSAANGFLAIHSMFPCSAISITCLAHQRVFSLVMPAGKTGGFPPWCPKPTPQNELAPFASKKSNKSSNRIANRWVEPGAWSPGAGRTAFTSLCRMPSS